LKVAVCDTLHSSLIVPQLLAQIWYHRNRYIFNADRKSLRLTSPFLITSAFSIAAHALHNAIAPTPFPNPVGIGEACRAIASSLHLGYLLSRADAALAPVNYVFLPIFNLLTRNRYTPFMGSPFRGIANKYRSFRGRGNKPFKSAHSNLFMMGLFAMTLADVILRLKRRHIFPSSWDEWREWWLGADLIDRFRSATSKVIEEIDHAIVGFLMCHVCYFIHFTPSLSLSHSH